VGLKKLSKNFKKTKRLGKGKYQTLILYQNKRKNIEIYDKIEANEEKRGSEMRARKEKCFKLN
jgi:hypothetical protein